MLPASIATALRAAIAEDNGAWPEFSLSVEEFLRHLQDREQRQEHHGGTEPRSDSPPASHRHLADRYLAWACVRGDAQALRVLETDHLRPLGAALSRIDPSADFIDEVLQRARQKLLLPDGERAPRLAEYSGRGALRGFLRAAVMRTALNLRRDQRFAAGAGAPDSGLAALHHDPERIGIDAEQLQILKEELSAALEALPLRQRNLLRLHLIDGATIDNLAVVFAVHRATVARWIAAAREELHRSLRSRLARRVGTTEDLVAGHFGPLASNIDLSLSRLLPRTDLATRVHSDG